MGATSSNIKYCWLWLEKSWTCLIYSGQWNFHKKGHPLGICFVWHNEMHARLSSFIYTFCLLRTIRRRAPYVIERNACFLWLLSAFLSFFAECHEIMFSSSCIFFRAWLVNDTHVPPLWFISHTSPCYCFRTCFLGLILPATVRPRKGTKHENTSVTSCGLRSPFCKLNFIRISIMIKSLLLKLKYICSTKKRSNSKFTMAHFFDEIFVSGLLDFRLPIAYSTVFAYAYLQS